jgi:twitching motility protein PilU
MDEHGNTSISSSTIGGYLRTLVEKGGSDLFITVGVPPKIKVKGDFHNIADTVAVSNAEIRKMLEEILNEDQFREFESILEMNLALSDDAGERFRMNLFFQQRNYGVVIRHIKGIIPTMESLALPDIYKRFIMEKRGLFLMVGSTGSGKSTSLASMLEYRNQNGSGHIVTVEDPIEYVFTHKNCIFTQREVNIDTYSFSIAMKNALRQAPDVLFVGELRDREAIENAIVFAETGHLVIATIHSSTAGQTFERILSMFPEEFHSKIMTSLAHSLNAVVGQRLMKGIDGKTKLAYEILINEGLITELIRTLDLNGMREVMSKNQDNGMITFDDCLFNMVKRGVIDKETALSEADNKHNLRLKLSQYSSSNIPQTIASSIKTSLKDDF